MAGVGPSSTAQSAMARNAAEMLRPLACSVNASLTTAHAEQQHEEREGLPIAGIGQRDAGHDRPDQQPALTQR